jgi:hypothetical protein
MAQARKSILTIVVMDSLMCNCTSKLALRAPRNDGSDEAPAKKEKGPTFVGPVRGLAPLRTGPIPTAPGGWGLRNPEPKGPGQRRIFFLQGSGAVDGRKWGSNMISSNDPVTPGFRRSGNRPCPRRYLSRASCSVRRLAQSCTSRHDPEKWAPVFGTRSCLR